MCKVLGQIGGELAVKVLGKLVRDDPQLSIYAALALKDVEERMF